MGKTSIEWTQGLGKGTGYSWNPIRGVKGKWHCTKVSPGCHRCYAERLNKRWSKLPYTKGADTFRLDEKVLLQPLRWKKPRMVFVCSMTDLFHEDIHGEWLDAIFGVMMAAAEEGHTFQVLTKRADRMSRYVKQAVDGIWLGVSAEDQQRWDERVPYLLQTPAVVRWVSVEPMLGPLNTVDWMLRGAEIPCPRCKGKGYHHGFGERGIDPDWCVRCGGPGLDWVKPDWIVCGGESGPGARPMNPGWAASLKEDCNYAHVPFFMKQMGGRQGKGGKLEDIPADLRIREYPEVAT